MEVKNNNTGRYRLTIIVPVYNEEENIGFLEQRLADFLPACKYATCVLFVNDGSKDNSLDLLMNACGRQDHFYCISLDKNGGLSTAMKAGIDVAFSDYIGYLDADLQTAPEDFNLLLEYIEEYELVMGIRAGREDSWSKKLQSRVANGFRRMMTHDGVSDTGCPLKVIRTDYAKRIPFFTGMHRFLPALIQLQNGKVLQIPVSHFPRVAGVSKYHLWNRLVAPFLDCFAYRWMKKRYINYAIRESNL